MTAPNRLAAEASLYLQMHAHNPVDWHAWGEEPLALARAERRLIFLSSGYASCHWCHVMEREVFEDAAVAAALNRDFVCIKVDREERPDIDATYMQAAMALTGGGGWPLSVFLTPTLEPFHAATYVPRDAFLALLARIQAVYRQQPGDLQVQATRLAAQVLAVPRLPAAAGDDIDDGLLDGAVAAAREGFDEEHGGFASRQKFPVPARWRFLLHRWRQSGDPAARDMVVRTLEAMARGGLRDHLGGGFHRYTVDAAWTVPHFEKMLYDNAQLATLYLEAGAALDRPDLVAEGTATLDFLRRDMLAPQGGVHASIDADSEGEEGLYYVWSPTELASILGPADGGVVSDLLGVTAAGNFERGASVLSRRTDLATVAARHGRDPGDVQDLLERSREVLRRRRDERVAPTLDRKIITSWNGLAITAFAAGAATTGRADYLAAACRAADHLRAQHRRADGSLARASTAGCAAGEGVLDDYAFLAAGLLDLFQVSGDEDHLAWARELVAMIRRDFARADGAFYLTRAGMETPLGRRVELFDNVVPSGCAVAITVMLRLGALAGDEALTAEAREHLRGQLGLLRRAGTDMAAWLAAAQLMAAPLYTVVVAGDRSDPRTTALVNAAIGTWPSRVVLTQAPAVGVTGDGPRAHVCYGKSCLVPIAEVGGLTAALRAGWYR